MFLAVPGLAHLEEHETEVHGTVWERLEIPDPVFLMYVAAVAIILVVLYSLFMKSNMDEKAKKVAFVLISAAAISSTLYLGGTTVYLNIASDSGGPVHWHADYEVWACGAKYELVEPEGFESFVGDPLFHEHGDNRIHIEGVVLRFSDVSFGKFFEAVGGKFDGEVLRLPTESGVKEWKNGDFCGAASGTWRVFVNGALTEEPESYVIAPHSTVPPGDEIKMVFSEKVVGDINLEMGVPP